MKPLTEMLFSVSKLNAHGTSRKLNSLLWCGWTVGWWFLGKHLPHRTNMQSLSYLTCFLLIRLALYFLSGQLHQVQPPLRVANLLGSWFSDAKTCFVSSYASVGHVKWWWDKVKAGMYMCSYIYVYIYIHLYIYIYLHILHLLYILLSGAALPYAVSWILLP